MKRYGGFVPIAMVMLTLSMLLIGQAEVAIAKDDVITLRFSTHMSAAHKQVTNAMDPYAKMIKEASGGRLNVKIYTGGVLHGPKDGFKACASDITDFTQAYPGYMPGNFHMYFALHLPFLFPNGYVATLVTEELYPKYLKKEYEAMGVYLMASPQTSTYQILTKDKPIRRLEDLKGVKLRSPGGLTNDIIASLGAVPVSIPAVETYTGLQTGLVDGVFMNKIDIVANRLYETAKYLTFLDVSVYAVPTAMNKKTYDSLPKNLRLIVYNSNRKFAQMMTGSYEKDAEKQLREVANKYGMVITSLSEKEKSHFTDAVKNLENVFIKENEARGLPVREFLKEIRALTTKYEKWSPEQIWEQVSKYPIQGIN